MTKQYSRLKWETVTYAIDKPNRNEDECVDITIYSDGLFYAEILPVQIIHGNPGSGYVYNLRFEIDNIGIASRNYHTLNQAKAAAHKMIQEIWAKYEFETHTKR